jgi:hypothetical protein
MNARGDNTMMTMRRQATFGTAEAASEGGFRRLPFYVFDVDPTEELATDEAIRGSSYPGDIVAGLQNMSGKLEVPLGLQSIGWHLAAMFGDPATSEPTSGNFEHVFTPAEIPDPALQTACKSFLGVNTHFAQDSIVYKGLELSAKKEGRRQKVSFDLIGRQEVKVGAALDGSPVEFANDLTPVAFIGKAMVDGAEAAAITGITGKAANEAEMDQEEMNGLPTASGLTAGDWMFDGSIDTRFRDATYYDLAENGTLFDLSLVFEISPVRKIEFTWYKVRLERKGVPVSGREVISASFNFRVGRPAPGSVPFRVVLKNDVASYGNPS